MASLLWVGRLYVTQKDGDRAMMLIPLITIGPSPQSAKNACYFFNRMEKEGTRFVSYHFVDQPEIKERNQDAMNAIRFLTMSE